MVQPSDRGLFPALTIPFFFSKISKPVLRAIWPRTSRAVEAVSPGVKLMEHEADHSPPSNSEVKNEWVYTSTNQYAFTVCARAIFSLYLSVKQEND